MGWPVTIHAAASRSVWHWQSIAVVFRTCTASLLHHTFSLAPPASPSHHLNYSLLPTPLTSVDRVRAAAEQLAKATPSAAPAPWIFNAGLYNYQLIQDSYEESSFS